MKMERTNLAEKRSTPIIGRIAELWSQKYKKTYAANRTDIAPHPTTSVVVTGNSGTDCTILLSLLPTPFRVRLEESVLFAHSPLDCLLLPMTLGYAITVESTCPADGSAIQISISPATITASIERCVLCIPLPDQTEAYDPYHISKLQNGHYRMMRFLSSPTTAALWTIAYPGIFILNLQQAWTLASSIYNRL